MKKFIAGNTEQTINEQNQSNENGYLGLVKHARFVQNYADLHARPFLVSTIPLSVSQLCFLHDDRVTHQQELQHINELCLRYSVNPPASDAMCFYQSIGEYEIRWERHTEFSSYTFLLHDNKHQPFENLPISIVPCDWLQRIPGEVIAAVHVEALADNSTDISRESLRCYFEGQRLIGSKLHQESAVIYSALRLHHDDFNRILLINSDLNECQSGRVLRALLEIEAYRNMTLLAFPLAQDVSLQVTEMESQLAKLLHQQKQITSADDEKAQLAELLEMAAVVAELIANTRYRFDAGMAYYQMVKSRLEELEEQEINELQTFTAFIERRLSPACRTVLAAKRRLDDLATRVDRASDFLRTRIDMAIEVQNQALLTSMEKRARMQFNLQQTVEGLSVVILTYYVLQLCEYLLGAVSYFGLPNNKAISMLLLLPLVFSIVWLLSRRLKKRLRKIE